MYKLIFFVPESALEQVKAALFAKGAGRSEKYSHCCWQSLGELQFKPLANSNPAIGDNQTLTTTKEYKVEMVCASQVIEQVIAELERVHPYEEPAYEVYRLHKSAAELK